MHKWNPGEWVGGPIVPPGSGALAAHGIVIAGGRAPEQGRGIWVQNPGDTHGYVPIDLVRPAQADAVLNAQAARASFAWGT